MKGDPGADGSARAYGYISGTTVTRAKNVVSATNPQAGVICVTLDPSISLATVVPVASADFQYDDTIASSGKLSFIEPRIVPFICSASQVEFDTGYIVNATGVGKNEPFFFTIS